MHTHLRHHGQYRRCGSAPRGGIPQFDGLIPAQQYAALWDENATKNTATECSSIGTISMLCAQDKRQQHHTRLTRRTCLAGTTVVALRSARRPCPTSQAENAHRLWHHGIP